MPLIGRTQCNRLSIVGVLLLSQPVLRVLYIRTALGGVSIQWLLLVCYMYYVHYKLIGFEVWLAGVLSSAILSYLSQLIHLTVASI